MAEAAGSDRWWIGIFGRALVAGMAVGGIATAGWLVVLGGGGASSVGRSLVVATAFFAAAVGLWAGAPEVDEPEVGVSARWLSAAAITALGGSFATFRILYEPAMPGPWWQLGSVLLVLAIPIYATMLLGPMLLAWGETIVDAEAPEVPGWGALGPLVTGVLLGVPTGLVLANVAAIPLWGPSILMMASAVLLLVPLALPTPEATATRETELFATVSPFGDLRVSEVVYPGERQPERRLYLNGEEESSELVRSGAPTLAYIAAAESWLSAITPPGARFLFLGGGAYTLPRRVAERDRRARIVVVELDPEVTAIAQRFFGLKPAHDITSVHGDARAYLREAAPEAFDRLYVDVYGGDEHLPHALLTQEAVGEMRRVLSADGVAGVNVIGMAAGEERLQLWSIVRTFASVFTHVALYHHLGRDYPERQNFLLAGSMDPDRAFPARAGHFDRWPADEWPSLDGAVVYRDLSPSAESVPTAARPSPPTTSRARSQTT